MWVVKLERNRNSKMRQNGKIILDRRQNKMVESSQNDTND